MTHKTENIDRRITWLPLLNVRIDQTRELGNGVSIAIWDREPIVAPTYQGYTDPAKPHAALVIIDSDVSHGLGCFDNTVRSRLIFSLALVELATGGQAWIHQIVSETQQYNGEGHCIIGSYSTMPSYGDHQRSPSPVIDLLPEDIERIRTASTILMSNSDAARRASLALRRWYSSRERPIVEDALLDTWIGLEAIFVLRSEPKRETASRRISRFLAGQPVQSGRHSESTLYEYAYDAYDHRSCIVHGDVTKRDPILAACQSEQMLRDTLILTVYRATLDSIEQAALKRIYTPP